METNFCTGLKNVEVYKKEGKFFLKITFKVITEKGDVYENTLDSISLDLNVGQDVIIKQTNNIGWNDYFPARYNCLNHDYSYCLYSGNHEYNIDNDECEQTSTLIKKHTERYTMEELEKKLGCHLEIVSNKENK